jgi:hypothetical protein
MTRSAKLALLAFLLMSASGGQGAVAKSMEGSVMVWLRLIHDKLLIW